MTEGSATDIANDKKAGEPMGKGCGEVLALLVVFVVSTVIVIGQRVRRWLGW